MIVRGLLSGAVTVLLVSASGCIDDPGSGPPAEWYLLRRELSVDDLKGVRASFTPALSGKYTVTLNFPQPMEDQQSRDLVNKAASSVGVHEGPARFDFEWRVRDADRLIARGSGQEGATGTIDTGSWGLGGGPLISRALAFGGFSAEARRQYTIEMKVGAEFAMVMRGKPRLEVLLDPTSRR